jgi:hypothetical protein
MKKNMIAFNIPKFITNESKLNLPTVKKSLINKRRNTTVEITKISLSKISPKPSTGETNNLRINNTTANKSSNCIFKFFRRFPADILISMK